MPLRLEIKEHKDPSAILWCLMQLYEVREEINRCYELINRLGRGVVYLGSSRMGPGHSHYVQAQELSKEIANLLDCTSWSGAGPGLMNAVTQGALQAGKPVGRFKIGKEAGEWTASNYHPYLPSENYLTCRKACNMGSETPPDALSPSSTTCKQDLRWREVEKAIPLKKRRGEFDNNMEGNISDSNRKKTNKIQSRSSRTKMNMAWEQDDDEIIKEEEKEAEEEVVAVDEEEEEEEVEKVRERIQTKKVSKKKRVRGGALMEGSRCSRVNGRGWRCCQPTLVGYSLCEHHLGKGRLRSMTSVRSRSIATPTTAGAPKKLHRQLVPPSDNEAANSSSSYSNNNAKETNCVVARHDDDGYANHHAGGGGEDDHDDEKKPMTVTTKKRVKLGTVKARSISSLLGQTNNEIAMPDNNNNNVN